LDIVVNSPHMIEKRHQIKRTENLNTLPRET